MKARVVISCLAFLILTSVGTQAFKDRDVPLLFPPVAHAYPPIDSSLRELGRHLFYDPILSIDSTIACASCHQQSAAFSDFGRAMSTGIRANTTKRNAMPLFNLVWYEEFMWDGASASLEEQLSHPLLNENEMANDWQSILKKLKRSSLYPRLFNDLPLTKENVTKAIVEFERSLISATSKYDLVIRGEAKFNEQELAGFEFVNDQSMGNCLHCHVSDAHALGTTGAFSNNGLDPVIAGKDYADKGYGAITGEDSDMGKFRIPSFRNLGFTAPYMHDGRFKTLGDVLDFYSAGLHASFNVDSKLNAAQKGGLSLSQEEKSNILAFLNTLNDTSFTQDPAHSSPFE